MDKQKKTMQVKAPKVVTYKFGDVVLGSMNHSFATFLVVVIADMGEQLTGINADNYTLIDISKASLFTRKLTPQEILGASTIRSMIVPSVPVAKKYDNTLSINALFQAEQHSLESFLSLSRRLHRQPFANHGIKCTVLSESFKEGGEKGSIPKRLTVTKQVVDNDLTEQALGDLDVDNLDLVNSLKP